MSLGNAFASVHVTLSKVFGETAVLRNPHRVFDSATGAYTENNFDTTVYTQPAEYFSNYAIANDLAKQSDISMEISAQDPNGSAIPEPTKDMILLYNGVEYSIMSVEPERVTGSAVGYKLHLRLA